MAAPRDVWTSVLVITAVFSTTAQILFPAFLGKALDSALDGGAGISGWVIGCLAAVVTMAAADALFELAAGAGAVRGTALLRRSMLGTLVSWTGPGTPRTTAGDLVSRMVGAAAEAGGVAAVLVRAAVSVVPAAGSVQQQRAAEGQPGLPFHRGRDPVYAGQVDVEDRHVRRACRAVGTMRSPWSTAATTSRSDSWDNSAVSA
ncbi:ABC transporter ATP-binding protein [Streptomyces azureus]|uniref:ABC transmembrane type-1 domain-containing protein n=1 Tax=Streptomyces azureus TaxID=146537 RepID=A0A0K8PXI7_STRAJ|nr:uncharacterized protein SAZU_7048 [Streptomyces azureus]